LLLLSCCVPALANDSEIAFGGSPRLVTGKSTVSMQSENVKISIGDESVKVECRFVFKNYGPACTVRMGFPDQGEGAANPEEEGPVKHIKGTFDSFKSWVGGQPVSTKLIRAERPGHYWHAKTVQFASNATVEVRDLYTVTVGSQITRDAGSVRQAAYMLHTGSSWAGNIGKTEIEVSFHRKDVSGPLKVVQIPSGGEVYGDKTVPLHPHGIAFRGGCAPAISGTTLRFVLTNWRPTKKDDLLLLFGYYRPNVTSSKAGRQSTPSG